MKRLPLFAALAASALLPGCGFHPLYGSGAGGQKSDIAELQEVRVDTIADRVGQEFRNALIDRLEPEGVPPPPAYELRVVYNELQQDLGLTNDATTTRGQLSVTATFKLTDIATGAAETSGSTQEIVGYNIQYSEFGTIVSRDDAEQRAVRSLSDNIVARLAFYFENKHRAPERAKIEQDRAATQQAAPMGNTGQLNPVNPTFQPLTNTDPFAGQTPISQPP